MKVYVAQLNVLPGRPADNFKAIKAAVALAKKAGADMVVFPENAIHGNPSAIGMRQNEAEFQKACSEAERSLQKLSKGIEILVGSSEGFDECMYSHYVDGNMDGWDHDFEVYSAAQQRWLEVSSVSNFESYQANRLKLRYKDENGKTQLAHTLNGSSLALPRILAAIIEDYQTPDGHVVVPEVLRKYTGFDII